MAERWRAVAEMVFPRPARNREDVEAVTRELVASGVDGIAIVMLTYGPAMRTVRALSRRRYRSLLANVQPQRAVTAEWDMDDLTYNQGIHGAQDQANALVRAGIPFSVITGRLALGRVRARVRGLGEGGETVTSCKQARIALLGYPMNGMGDILYDPPAMLRRIGPTIVSEDLGALVARVERVAESDVESLLNEHRKRFAVADDLPPERHAYAARLELAIRGMLSDNDYRGFSFHFDSIGGDGRFSSCRCWRPRI